LLLGAAAPRVFTAIGMPMIGSVAQGIGIIGGTMMVGYGVWWFLLAILTTARYLRQEGMPFNIGWWGFTFPLGVYAVAVLALARQTHLGFITVFGALLVILLALLWCVIAARTLRGAWTRALFVSPCLISGSIPSDFTADEV
jgi:tellurite resistance protein TehA-like permease